ncbi:MAG: hypothetical protein AB4290_26065 [Spirulina sp.]
MFRFLSASQSRQILIEKVRSELSDDKFKRERELLLRRSPAIGILFVQLCKLAIAPRNHAKI